MRPAQAAMGLGYAASSLLGGPLAAADIRYAYAASCAVGCCVLACIAFGLRETLPASRRVPFSRGSLDSSPLAFVRLFQRGRLSAKLNLLMLLQSITNGMGDLWQAISPVSPPYLFHHHAEWNGRPVAGPRARVARVGRRAVRPLRRHRRGVVDARHTAHWPEHTTPRCARAHGGHHVLVGRGIDRLRPSHQHGRGVRGRGPHGTRRGQVAGETRPPSPQPQPQL